MSAIFCQCKGDEDDRPLTLNPLPTGEFQVCCDECGEAIIDDDPQNWRDLASAAIADMFRYADDELPHRRMVSANAYLARFELLDTKPSPTPDPTPCTPADTKGMKDGPRG